MAVLPKDLQRAKSSMSALSNRLGVEVVAATGAKVRDLHGGCGALNRNNCWHPFRLGVKIHKGSPTGTTCTMGFHMKHASNSSLNHTFLTAGHCGYSGSNWWHHSSFYKTNFGTIGSEKKTAFTSSKKRDIMLVKIQDGSNDDWDQNKTSRVFGENQNASMQSARNPVNGEGACVSPGNSGTVRCGTVWTANVWWTSTTTGWRIKGKGMNFNPRAGLIGGDSGSPLYHRNSTTIPPKLTPLGIVAASREEWDVNPAPSKLRDVYFTRIMYAVNNWGVTVYKGGSNGH